MNSQQHEKAPQQMLRLNDVAKLCGLSNGKINEYTRDGAFPGAINLTVQAEIVDVRPLAPSLRRTLVTDPPRNDDPIAAYKAIGA
jgi:predicted DNA-binding transcriptional regulator AlpA